MGSLRLSVALSSLVALTLGCADEPPRAVYPPGWNESQPAPAAGESGPPSAVTSDSSDQPGASYPALRGEPPPVAPPLGKGLEVPLQKYIVVDQFGYRTKMSKVAILVDPARGWNAGDEYRPGKTLEVKRWSDGVTVWSGSPTRFKDGAVDAASGDRGAWLDFSAVAAKGLYYVFDAQNNARSYPFAVDDDVYRPVLKSAARMYYFNRANFAKKPPYSCVGQRCWSLGVDYMGPGQDREARSVTDRKNAKTARDLSGGWWDAGDINKYVTFASEPVHQLLTAYEEHPSAFTDDFNIPESGNGVPDLLDEVLVELRWLEKMQPPDLGGGALIKVGVVDYGDPIPDRSHFPRYYYPEPCSSATIVVASQFAHAALVLKAFPRFANDVGELTRRARDAWSYYQNHPKSDACDDGTIKSGDADRSVGDQAQDAVVAAVYLFALTGEREFGDYVAKNYAATRPFQADDWSVYSPSQGDALLFYTSLAGAAPAAKQAILERRTRLLNDVDLFGWRPDLDLYRAYMRESMYHWGSNNQRGAVGNSNYDAVRYGLVAPEARGAFIERAAGMLHSFHGVNPMQLVYLTNEYADGGDACADELFHAWFRAGDPKWSDARTSELGPAPGYVTGGPNHHYCDGQDPNQNACARSPVRDQPPGKAYVDSNTGYDPTNQYAQSWELTEPGIYYQASYVRLVSKFVN